MAFAPVPLIEVSHGAALAAIAPKRIGRAQGRFHALAPELAFLVAHGVAPDTLLSSIASARRLGVHPVDWMIAEGIIHADFYYAALARHCRAPFCDEPAALSSGLRYPEAVHAGLAPMSGPGPRWLVAPRGPQAARLIRLATRERGAPAPFAVTTPQRLSAMAQAQARSEIAERASYDLPRLDAALSAAPRPGAGAAPWAGLAMLMVLALAFTPFAWLAVSLMFALVVAVRLAAAFASVTPAPAAALPDHALPTYTVLTAVYNEAAVLPGLIAALSRIDYPKARLDINVLVEARDRSTLAALSRLRLPPHINVVIAPDGAPRTKPRALNVALPLARGELIVVYDAEDRPEPRQLRLAAARFAQAPPEVACLQASLAIDNHAEGWLPQLFAIEYAALFDVLNPGLARLGWPTPLGGTSNHFRTDALRRCGGWDAWNVTEDADLGLRLARCGYRVETLASTTYEEAPREFAAWLGQRRRWQKGWMQTLKVHARQPRRLMRELGLPRAVAGAGLVVGMVAAPLFGPAFWAVTLWQVMFGELLSPHGWLGWVKTTLAISVFAGGVLCALLPAVIGLRRRRRLGAAPWLALAPAYYALIGLAAWQGLLELVRKPFHWQKTAHGARRPRA